MSIQTEVHGWAVFLWGALTAFQNIAKINFDIFWFGTLGNDEMVLTIDPICFRFFIVCSKKLDIVFAVDVSGSITSNEFSKQQAFLRSVADSISISHTRAARILVFGFDHNTNSIASSFEDREARFPNLIKQQINSLQLTLGATTMEEAIEEAKELFNTTSRNVPRVVVFLSDGVNYGGVESLRQPAQELRTVSGIRAVFLLSVVKPNQSDHSGQSQIK